MRVELVIARVFPLGRESQEEIGPCPQTARLEDGLNQRGRGAGPDAAFQHHHLTGAQMLRDGLRGSHDKAHVRVLCIGQRGRHADQHDIGVSQRSGILRCAEAPAVHRLRDPVLCQIRDDLITLIDPRNPVGVEVDAGGVEPFVIGGQRQRQADIAQSHHGNPRVARRNTLSEGLMM